MSTIKLPKDNTLASMLDLIRACMRTVPGA
jgi:hypothetical protein